MRKFKVRKNNILPFLAAIFIFVSCDFDDFTSPDDPKYDDIDSGQEDVAVDDSIMIDASDGVVINSEIFGINNDWTQVQDGDFASFATALDGISSTIFRFPGGWESEFYEWETNETPNWEKDPDDAGASIGTVKENVGNYSIVIPTVLAMNEELGSSAWDLAIDSLKKAAKSAITLSAMDGGIVEIGNEWWLQYAGGASRAQKLEKYANIAMELAVYIRSEFPDDNLKILVNGDYVYPDEFTDLKSFFTSGYDEIDGVALHTYAGYETETHNISDLEQRIIDCSNNFNPDNDFIYLSEWMPSRDYNNAAIYMEAANVIPEMIQIYARTGADAAAYWPPINSSVPGVGIMSWNFGVVYPVGQILGELSGSFKGKALNVSSDNLGVAAALQDNNTIVVYISGGASEDLMTKIKVDNFNIEGVEYVERYVPADDTDTQAAMPYVTESGSASLLSSNEVVIEINENVSYQIYKVVLDGEAL